MPYTGYAVGSEISSTFEGRHLVFVESALVHPAHADGLVDGKDPVIVGENIVGVALSGAEADTDLIAIDTEGLWALDVLAEDAAGASAVAVGDTIFINKATAVLSKIETAATNAIFGYALSTLAAGSTDVVAVKVHWGNLI